MARTVATARRQTAAVVAWYFKTYYGRTDEPGTLNLLCNPALVGSFAIPLAYIQGNDRNALFRLLIAAALFQRRRDWVVQRAMLQMSPSSVREITSVPALKRLRTRSACPVVRDHGEFLKRCDIAGRTVSGAMTCSVAPTLDCHVKRHARLFRRYADFGKLPASAELMLAEKRVRGLPELRTKILAREKDPTLRARLLESELRRVFRVSRKIAAMFLSWVANPEMTPRAPWADGVDWQDFLVIDSNVDAFLRAVGYSGPPAYTSRRLYLQDLAQSVDVSAFDSRLRSFNPRMVQQAMYIFMSRSNRLRSGDRCDTERCCNQWLICPLRSNGFAN